MEAVNTYGMTSNVSTPLPLRKIALCAITSLANNFSLAVCYPFLPFMVNGFYPNLRSSELGFLTGFLAASYNVGQLIGSLFWGWLADKIGRRPCMIAGIVGSLIASLVFMFSTSYEQAIIARLLWGLLNANIGICKTYLSEVCDDTNQGKAFTYYELISGSGSLFGPAIGGFLAQPARRYKERRRFR